MRDNCKNNSEEHAELVDKEEVTPQIKQAKAKKYRNIQRGERERKSRNKKRSQFDKKKKSHKKHY